MISGTIKRLVYNHHDDVDGWQLNDGTKVHFPPHVGHVLCEWIREGDEVSIEGERVSNRNDEEFVFPTYIESQGWSLTFEQKVPRIRDNGLHNSKHASDEEHRVTNADIMRKLNSIATLIESWGK